MKTQVMWLAALMLTGCGTVQTVALSEKSTAESLKDKKSYCGAVPRIYSGVTYDFCLLHAERPDSVDAYTYNNAPFGVAIDAIASGALDTLLLPYTLYKQHADGSIEIN